jgi:hypothetical protein
MEILAVKDSRKQCRDNHSQDSEAHVCRRCFKIEGAQKTHCEIEKAKIDDKDKQRALSTGPSKKSRAMAQKTKEDGEDKLFERQERLSVQTLLSGPAPRNAC